jgi:hypothetical protein
MFRRPACIAGGGARIVRTQLLRNPKLGKLGQQAIPV